MRPQHDAAHAPRAGLNPSEIGIYDGAYKCVALATGTKWERRLDGTGDGG